MIKSTKSATLWQQYPLPSEEFPAFNWDWLASVDPQAILHCYSTNTAVLNEAYIDMNV
jgi:ribulose-5-phosphate 4-epimerase/fuculose-1-phosphate aldolase